MPSCPKGALILVTGASGYIGAHTAREFLRAGYPVRATVRSKSKGEYLSNLLKGEKEKFEYVLVEDIGKEGAFDEAVKGVVGVAHTASPFHFDAQEPSELLDAAVGGTVGVLNSLKKNNPQCKRVVITASFACMVDPTKSGPVAYNDDSRNLHSAPEVQKHGAKADGRTKYRASKVLAEDAFWDFLKDEKPSFDGVTIHPPTVLGPIIHECNKPESLNTSVALFWDWMSGAQASADPLSAQGAVVDVRDVAKAHVQALAVEVAAGRRFLTSPGCALGTDYCEALKATYPDLKGVPEPSTDKAAIQKARDQMPRMDGSNTTKVLGVPYTPVQDTLQDMAKSLHERFMKA